MSDDKPNGKTNGAAMPPLIPQPGGRGALYAHGVPGNRGGGRPASKLRLNFMHMLGKGQKEAMRRLRAQEKVIEKRPSMEQLEAMEKDEILALIETGAFDTSALTDSALVKYMDVCAKYSIGSKHVIGNDEDIEPGVIRVPEISRRHDQQPPVH
jgi:hypothetical protein